MSDALRVLVGRIQPIILDQAANHPFWAAYTEDRLMVRELLSRHPMLALYSVCSWGTDTWIFRGDHGVNVLGYLLGLNDLGQDFSALIPEESEISG